MTPGNLYAINSSQIDNVLNKKVLNEQDFKVIDDYLRGAIDVLLNEQNMASIGRDRDAISTRKGTQPQYVYQFNQSAEKYLTEAFKTAKKITPKRRQMIVLTNLLILINSLDNVQFAVLAVNKLEDENAIVRYWAIRCLANPEVITQLNNNEASNPNLPLEITDKFIKMVPKASPEELNLMAKYAANINILKGEELLKLIVDKRIQSYADWTVKSEYIDGNLLIILEDKITNSPDKTDIPTLAREFAQLYSYIIQRYIKGEKVLNSNQKAQLVTDIIETEDICIRNMTGAQQNLRKAIEQNNLQALIKEHDRLLGGNSEPGLLPTKYNFDYGTSATGQKITSPLTLSNPK